VIRQLSASVRIQGEASVSALTVLMEVALRVDTPGVAVERLLSLASELVSSVKRVQLFGFASSQPSPS
jgi:phage gp45-like